MTSDIEFDLLLDSLRSPKARPDCEPTTPEDCRRVLEEAADVFMALGMWLHDNSNHVEGFRAHDLASFMEFIQEYGLTPEPPDVEDAEIEALRVREAKAFDLKVLVGSLHTWRLGRRSNAAQAVLTNLAEVLDKEKDPVAASISRELAVWIGTRAYST